MDHAASEYGELVAHLRNQNYSETDIETILQHVREYEQRTQIDSVMDAIADGSVKLDALVTEALKNNNKSS